MGCYEQVIQAVYNAIGEVNEGLEPEQALEKSPDTVFIGESGKLDSLGFVNLAVAVEENIERLFSERINVMDVLLADESGLLTVATLAKRIAKLVDNAMHE